MVFQSLRHRRVYAFHRMEQGKLIRVVSGGRSSLELRSHILNRHGVVVGDLDAKILLCHGGALEYRVVHGVPRQFIDEIVFSKVIHG